jgi:hypothetical protein
LIVTVSALGAAMVTSSVEVGTISVDQFEATSQSPPLGFVQLIVAMEFLHPPGHADTTARTFLKIYSSGASVLTAREPVIPNGPNFGG